MSMNVYFLHQQNLLLTSTIFDCGERSQIRMVSNSGFPLQSLGTSIPHMNSTCCYDVLERYKKYSR